MKVEPIWSTDGGKVALLRHSKIFKIGELRDGYVMGKNGEFSPCTILSWDFFEDGEKDIFYFSINKKLLFWSISSSCPTYINKTFRELVEKGADLSTLVNVVQSKFIMTELGF